VGLARDIAALPAELAGNIHRALTTPVRWSNAQPKPREKWNSWPRTGDPRTCAGQKQIYHHGWVGPTREESTSTPGMVPDPAYPKAQRAARQARAAGPRIGRSPR
jgi:hypothetical protein